MILEHIIGLIAPHYCLNCGKAGDVLCAGCTMSIELLPPRCYVCQSLSGSFKTCAQCSGGGLNQVFCVTEYNGLAKETVRKLKFGRSPATAKVIARMLCRIVPDGDWLVVPVPTASNRVRQRGYDQAQLIAKEIAQHKKLDYSPLLLRSGQKRQVGQTRRQRQEQISDSFSLLPISRRKITNRQILLVDDVVTTGATLEAASKILQRHKPAMVCGAVFAAA